jgi:hypothetical protein
MERIPETRKMHSLSRPNLISLTTTSRAARSILGGSLIFVIHPRDPFDQKFHSPVMILTDLLRNIKQSRKLNFVIHGTDS